MILSAKEFRKVWQQQNPNVIHIPSEYELRLMQQYAKYYHEQQVKNCSIPVVVGSCSKDVHKSLKEHCGIHKCRKCGELL